MQTPTTEQNQLDPYFLQIAASFVKRFSAFGRYNNYSNATSTDKEQILYCRIITLFSQEKADKVVEMAKLLAIPWLACSNPSPDAIVESNLMGFLKVLLRKSPARIDADFIYCWAMTKNFLDIVKLMINDKRVDITSKNNFCIKLAIEGCAEAKTQYDRKTEYLKNLEAQKTQELAKRVAPDKTSSQNLKYLILQTKKSLEESEVYLKKSQNILYLLFQRALASKDNYQKIMHIAKNEGQLEVIKHLFAYEKLLKLHNIGTNTALFTDRVKEDTLLYFINHGILNGVKFLLEDKPEQEYMETVYALLKKYPVHMKDYATKHYKKMLALAISSQREDNIQFLCQYTHHMSNEQYAVIFSHFIFAIRLSLNKGDQKTAFILIQNISLADSPQNSDAESKFLNIIFDLAIKKEAVEIVNFLSEKYKENLGDIGQKRTICLRENVRFFNENSNKLQAKRAITDNKNTLFGKNVAISTGSLPHDPVCEAGYYPLP